MAVRQAGSDDRGTVGRRRTAAATRARRVALGAAALATAALGPLLAAAQADRSTLTGDGSGALWLLAVAVPALAYTAWFLARRRAASRRSGPEPRWQEAAPDAAPPSPEHPDGEKPHSFSFYEETFRTLVASVGVSQSDQERSYIEVIGAMVATAHARDHETIGHSFRVARYAVTLAERMQLGGETLTAIEWGALLHDVGKIAVPEGVLRKSGPLTEDETRVMREHPRRGYQMLRGLLFLGTALDVVLSHHERWDGRGYPNGLSGETIPLSARIFAVVDTYDAITSDRPYRPARSHGEAVEELQRVAGTQLDPRVVRTFLEIPEEELAELRDLTRAVETGPDAPSLRTAFDPTGERDLNGDGTPYGSWRVEEVG